MIDPTALAGLLPAHIARQRWSGAADRPIRAVTLDWFDELDEGPPALAWVGATASFADGGEQSYQLFLGARAAGDTPEFLQGKERELVGWDGDTIVYDALVDPDLAIDVLHLVDPDRQVEVRRPLVLEHSNSSVVFDESVILKLFRKVSAGANPDVEIPRTLAAQGNEHVMAPLASLRRDDIDLGVLREFLVGATEGWQLAHTSVRDMLASRLAPGECGGDFASDAERLGAILAELHVGLADAFGTEDGDPAAWADDMDAHLDEISALAGQALPFDPAEVRARYQELRGVSSPGRSVTIHGDLHLAQVMRGDSGWYVLDWEGEPARRREDRFTRSSPLRDVAGMLRSFHYAALTGLAEWDEDDSELSGLAADWEQRNRDAYLSGYRGVDGVEALLPGSGADFAVVLSAFELDKAVYEVGYELGHRPDLVSIPARAVTRLLS